MEWSNEQCMEFLELYEGEPAIWNPKHPHHKNRHKVHESWTRLSSIMNVSINELKGKKNSLMATFRSHRRRKEASIRAREEYIYQPIWFAFQKMEEFLAPVYDCGLTTNTLDADDALPLEESQPTETEQPEITDIESEESSQDCQEEVQLRTTSARNTSGVRPRHKFAAPATQREKRRRLVFEIDDTRNQVKQTFEMPKTNKKDQKEETDDCDLYGQLLAKKLRDYSTYERHLLMHNIDGFLLQNPPNSAMLSPFSSYSSSPTPSPINRHLPAKHHHDSAAASYNPLVSQSPLVINISSRPKQPVQGEAVSVSFPQEAEPHSHESILPTKDTS